MDDILARNIIVDMYIENQLIENIMTNKSFRVCVACVVFVVVLSSSVYSNVPLVVCGVLMKIMSFFSNTRRRIPYINISKCSKNVRVLIFMPTKICNIFERIKSFLTYHIVTSTDLTK